MKITKILYNILPNSLKKYIKKDEIIYPLTKQNFEKYLLNYQIVSFDIFDTLITRLIYEPDDIFEIMEEKLKDINHSTSIKSIRKNAEIKAIDRLKKDVNIDEIYDELKRIYGYNNQEIEKIKNTEINLEIDLSIPRKDMIGILKTLMDSGKKVVLTSDMYLNKNILLQILKKCGYIEGIHFKKIFLSNDINRRKDNGKMWNYLKRKFMFRKIIHIGDNINSDYNIPLQKKINAINLENSRTQLKKTQYYTEIKSFIDERTISDSLFLGYLINEQIYNSPFSEGIDSLEKISKCFIAPMVYELIKFIDNKSDNNEKLLFLAREGYFLEKIYKDYCKIFNLKEKEHYYFLSSRKAAMSATIQTDEDLKKYLNRDYTGSLKSLFENLFDIKYQADDYEIKLPNHIDKVYEKVKEYKNDIFEKSKEYKQNYIKYFSKILNYKNDKFIIIDLGYSGTIQYHLSKMLDMDLKGIYLTNTNSVKQYSRKSKLEFLFDINDNKLYEKIYSYSLILEFFLSAPYGQLQYFSMKSNNVIPVYNNEQIDENKKKNIDEMYKYIIDYIMRMKELEAVCNLNINKDLLVSNYVSIIESNLIKTNIKDKFDFEDSFCSNEIKNIFKIIGRY